jgi:hypothetical protein
VFTVFAARKELNMQIAKDAVISALKLMGIVNSYGVVDENGCSKYFGVAPAYLNILVREIATAENTQAIQALQAVSSNIQGLDSVLDISDDSATRVLPFGLAMYFAVIDRDSELYNHFSQLYYGTLLPSVKADEVIIQDYYGVTSDRTLQ